MTFKTPPIKYFSKLLFITATLVVVFLVSLLQSNILKVDASLQVLLVSNTAIPFGAVFPGEQFSKTYTVQLDTSSQKATYSTALAPVVGRENLCPFLELKNIDLPLEPDSVASSSLFSVIDGTDSWQVKLTVPGIKGQVAQAHDGGIVVSGGNFECKITITANTVEVFGEGFIQGVKFNDLNGNGIKNSGENGLGGWQIYLDQNNNAVYDVGEKITTTATTTGFYTFEFLPVGTYTVREVLQNNWQQTLPGAGAGFKHEVFVNNQTAENINFGNRFVGDQGGCAGEDCGGGNLGSADLSLLKTVNKATTTASSTLIYTMVVANHGPGAATNVNMTDVLPAELVFISASSTQGVFVPNVWTIGSLASGSLATLQVVTEVKSATAVNAEIINKGSVQSAQADSVLSNNTSTATTLVVCPPGQICISSAGGGGGETSSGGGGGGSGFSGGGSSGGGGTAGLPNGQVLGDSTQNFDAGGDNANPLPQVLGASELPRTGIPGLAIIITAVISLGLARKIK